MDKATTSKLTIKQKRFADAYIELGNASEAARQAGYSPKTAGVIGSENLTKPVIKEYIDERMNVLEEDTIARQTEILQSLTAIMRDKTSRSNDKLKAAELLMKKYQMFGVEEETGDVVIEIGLVE